jgi:predicted RecA/RadA family phage recombinase
MKNMIQPGATVTAAAPYAVASGAGALLGGSLFGVAMGTYGSGADGEFATEGVFELTKTSGTAHDFTLGKRVYWDNSGKALVATSTGNHPVGVVTEAASTAAVLAKVKLGAPPALGA